MGTAHRDTPTAPPGPETPAVGRADAGVESNARLTASTAVVLLVLLVAEGVTILRIHSLLSPHVFIGMLLVPPVVLKMGSTAYRFVRYYQGSPAYRRKGPPPVVLRLLGPFVVASTVVVLASGIALMLVPRSLRSSTLLLHKASFILWFGAMTIHVLGHLWDTTHLAPRDWARRTRSDVRGAGVRRWAVVASVALGVPLGFLLLGRVGPWESHRNPSITAQHTAAPGSPASAPTTTNGAPAPAGVPTPTVPSLHLGTVPPSPTSTSGTLPTATLPTPSPRHAGKARAHRHAGKKSTHGA